MDTADYKKIERNHYWNAFWSPTLRTYYGALIGTMIIVCSQ
jgi:hypothetical protein